MSSLGKGSEAVSRAVQTEKHQGRIQGDRVERVCGDPEQLARRSDGGDNGNSSGEMAKRVTESLGIQATVLMPTRFQGLAASPAAGTRSTAGIQAALARLSLKQWFRSGPNT